MSKRFIHKELASVWVSRNWLRFSHLIHLSLLVAGGDPVGSPAGVRGIGCVLRNGGSECRGDAGGTGGGTGIGFVLHILVGVVAGNW